MFEVTTGDKTMSANDNHRKAQLWSLFIVLYCSCQPVWVFKSTHLVPHNEKDTKNYFLGLNVPGLEENVQKNKRGFEAAWLCS